MVKSKYNSAMPPERKDQYKHPIMLKYLTTEEIQYLKDNYLKIIFEADERAHLIRKKIPLQEMIDYDDAEEARLKRDKEREEADKIK